MSQSLAVVIADDDPTVLRCLALWLAQLGHRVTTATDGRELLDACRASAPDLVLSDVQMPRLGGLAAAALLRAESAVPIVLMSGSWERGQLAEATALGAACLQKPVGPMALAGAVRRAVPDPADEPTGQPLARGAGQAG